MSTFTQSGPKRQKIRENRAVDNIDYFQGMEKVEYSPSQSTTDILKYRYYNNTERVHGRSMEEWLKFSVSMKDFNCNGADQYGRPTHQRQWDDKSNTIDNSKRTIKACFDFCTKLGIKYFTAFDSDLVPWTDSWDETKLFWDDILEYLQENISRSHVKPLWIAADLHSHPRFASGAITSTEASTFAYSATRIKKCLEISQKLNCECFPIWPLREHYEGVYKIDLQREIKLLSKLLKLTADYKERLGYRGQLLVQPGYPDFTGKKPGYPDVTGKKPGFWYMGDVIACMFWLKQNNLERFYKICSPLDNQLYFAYAFNMVGGVVISDHNDFHDIKAFAELMECILKQGTIPQGGINLQLCPKRHSTATRDTLATYTRYIDAMAKALRIAHKVASDQELAKQVQQKYESYYNGFGARVVSGDVSMEECEEQYRKHQGNEDVPSSRSEQLDILCQRYLDTFDQHL